MAFVHESLHLLLFFVSLSRCCLPSISTTYKTTTLAPSTSKPHRLVSKLIHYNSIHHPRYNPNETSKEKMKLDIEHSITRLAYLKARIEGSLVSNNGYRSSLSPSLTGRTILANLSIGQPPIPQLLIMDTASHIFWTMCTPCTSCNHYLGQLFDPSKSSTYSPSCREPCYFDNCECNLTNQRTYSISYADKSFSSGTVGSDTIVFETDDEGITRVNKIEFGCAHDIIYNPDPGYNGVLGLGLNSGRLSLAAQIGKTFSYCIGSLADKHYNYNQLILGEGANLEGYTTHFEVHYGLNYVTMEGVSVGEKSLDIVPSTFQIKENGTGGVIIDTGSTFSFFVDDVYKLLYNEIQNLFQGSLRQARIPKFPWMLCYFGSVSRDLIGFPVVTFQFAGGADLVLDSLSFFQQMGDHVFCMAVSPISEIGMDVSVIGLLAQQSYNVGYDQVNGLIYFQRIDCELLSS